MSGKRRRSETSWDMRQDKRHLPEVRWQDKDLNSSIRPPRSSDPRRPCWQGNKNDDISSRDRHGRTFDEEWERPYTTRLPYRDRSRSPNRSRSRDWESRSLFCDDRHKSNEYGRDRVRNNSRPFAAAGDSRGDNLKESRSRRPAGGSRYGRFHHYGDDDDDDQPLPNQISKIQCRFFAAGNCSRDNCKFSHHVHSHHRDDDPRSHDNIRGTWQHADVNFSEKKKSWDHKGHASDDNKKSSWDDDDNKNRSWNGPSWDNIGSGNGGTQSDGKTNSWNGTCWVDNKTTKWDDPPVLNEKVSEKNDHLFPKQHNVVVNDSHINHEDNQQILISEEGKVSPKKKQEVVGISEQEAEEKIKEGTVIVKDEKCMGQRRDTSSRSPFSDDRHKSTNENENENENGGHVRNCKDFGAAGDCRKGSHWSSSRSRYNHNRNSRDHYDDDDQDQDGRRQSNRISRIQCKFFSAGKCHRDDCKFFHDAPHSQHCDTRSHEKWHDRQPQHADLNASDFMSEKNKLCHGPTWDDVESGGFVERSHNSILSRTSDDKNKSWGDGFSGNKWDSDDKKKSWGDGFNESNWDSHNSDDKKKLSQDKDVSNPNLDNKNGPWNAPSWDDEVEGGKLGNINIDEKTKSWVQMADEKGCEKHNVVNDSHLNNGNILSEEANQQIPPLYNTEQNLVNAIDYLKSLPYSAHNQDTRPKPGNIGNDVIENENPKKKHKQVGNDNAVAENAKQEQENLNPEKVKGGNNIGNDEKCMRQFRIALVDSVKEILKPKWKEGKMTREVYKTVVRKVVDKVTSSIQEIQVPRTQAKIELYLTHSKPKLMKLVEAYVDKLVKA